MTCRKLVKKLLVKILNFIRQFDYFIILFLKNMIRYIYAKAYNSRVTDCGKAKKEGLNWTQPIPEDSNSRIGKDLHDLNSQIGGREKHQPGWCNQHGFWLTKHPRDRRNQVWQIPPVSVCFDPWGRHFWPSAWVLCCTELFTKIKLMQMTLSNILKPSRWLSPGERKE